MMRHLVLALLVLATVAGCLADDKAPDKPAPEQVGTTTDEGVFVASAYDANGLPLPALLCQPMLAEEAAWHQSGQRCNFLMTPDAGRQGNEVTIAVNPTDPRNVVGGAKDYYPADAGQCVWDGIYVTHDGFATQTQDRSFDGSPWHLAQGDPQGFQQNYASQFWCTTDPVAYFDVNGNLYYLLMAYQADPVTGSATCKEQCPNGGLNDWVFNRAAQIVAKSSNGGDSFDTFTPVLEGSFPVDFHDKGWVAASRSGVIHVMWLASLAPGNLYFRSTDGGQTFPLTESETMASTLQDAGQGSFLDVGTNYEVYALWTSNTINLRRSLDDGATWEPVQNLLAPHGASMPGLSDRDRRNGFPAMATDRNPFSPNADNVYVVFQDACNAPVWSATCEPVDNGTAIYVMESKNKGTSFSTPVRVSDPSVKWRIFPAVSISPGGVVDVSWMEQGSRLAPASNTFNDIEDHFTLEESYAYSLNGGANWSSVFSVRDAGDGGWDPALCHHQDGKIFMGDYADIDSSWQAAHLVWPDTRDGKACKVYSATVRRPVFAEGWVQEDLVNALKIIRDHPLT